MQLKVERSVLIKPLPSKDQNRIAKCYSIICFKEIVINVITPILTRNEIILILICNVITDYNQYSIII